jgi:WD40 repeat protein/tetratricopeptide (TPR) repeat protein
MYEHAAIEATVSVPYASLEELKEEHTTLLRRRRGGFEADPSAFLDDVATFLRRGFASGSVLGDDAERYSAQSLLTFWSNVLYREGREVPEESLAEFNPDQAPELLDAECPYFRLEHLAAGEPLQTPGWQRLIDECLKVLERDRLLAVVGATGSGRSALIQGGVLPALRAGALPGSEGWQYPPPLVLGSVPVQDLLRHLHPAADAAWIEHAAADLRGTSALVVPPDDGGERPPTVLVVEEFDEMLRRTDRARIAAFTDALLILAEDPDGRHFIVIGTRPNNLSMVAGIGGFGKIFRRNQALMTFTSRELRQMVEEPAKRVGLKFDDGVVDRLLLDVQGDPAALTLLQFSLSMLWDHRQGNRITNEVYDRLGGGRLAVARQAEKTFCSLTPEQQSAAELALLRLVRLEGGTRVVCQAVPRSRLDPPGELSSGLRGALERLLADQVVVRTWCAESGDSDLSLVHDAVATDWPRFVGWIDGLRSRQRWHLQLRSAAEQWRDQDKNSGALWLGGVLERAEEERALLLAAGEDLSDLEREFLDASRRAERLRVWVRRGVVTFAMAAILLIAVLSSTISYMGWRAAEATAKAERFRADAEAREATQEATLKQKLGMTMAQWSTRKAMWLDEKEGDVAGAFLWLLEAWKQLQQNKKILPPREKEADEADYRLRLELTMRRLPRIADLLHHENIADSTVSQDGRFAVTVGRDGTARHWDTATGKVDDWRLFEEGQALAVNKVVVSSDGRYVVVCTGDTGDQGKAYLYEVNGKHADKDRKAVKVISHAGRVTLAVFSTLESDRLLATVAVTGDRKGEIKLWKTGTWEQVGETLPVAGTPKHVAFNPKRNRLAVAGQNEKGAVCVEWDLSQPAKFTSFSFPNYNYVSTRSGNFLAYSPDGARLAVACGVGEGRAFAYLFQSVGTDDQASSAQTALASTGSAWGVAVSPHDAALNHVAFSPDGQTLVTSSQDGTARLWDIRGNGAIRPRKLSHGSAVFAADFSPDGQFVVTASRDRRARIWEVETGEPVSVPLQHSGSVTDARFTPDGGRVITLSLDTVHAWDLFAGQGSPFRFAATHPVDSVHCDPRSLRVAAGGRAPLDVAADGLGRVPAAAGGHVPANDRGWARAWDGRTGKPLADELPHPRPVVHVALAPGNRPFLATVTKDSVLRTWDLSSGLKTFEQTCFNGHPTRYAAFSMDGRYLVVTGGEQCSTAGVARVYAVSTEGKLEAISPELKHGAPVIFAAFDCTGDRLVTVTGDADFKRGEATVWDRSGKRLSSLVDPQATAMGGKGVAHGETIRSAAFSLDGRIVVTASEDDTAALWDPATGKLRARLGGKAIQGVHQGHTADVVAASFSDRGDLVITTGEDGWAIIWDVSTGKQMTVLMHPKPLNHALFTRDSRQVSHVVTACRDGVARIWSIEGGRLIGLSRQPGTVLELGYSGDGPGAPLAIFSLRDPSGSWETERRDASVQAPLTSSNVELGAAVWDVAPGTELEFARLAEFGNAVAARRITSEGDVELETISPTKLEDAWNKARTANALMGHTLTNREWHDHMATAREAQRRWTAAIWHLDQLLAMHPDDASTYARRARAHLERGRADARVREASLIQAKDDLDRVLARDPKNGRAFLELAGIELEWNKWKEALDGFSMAEQLLGGNKRIWVGRAAAHMGELERLRSLARRRAPSPPGDVHPVGENELNAAIADYDRAVRVDPEDGLLHQKLAEACFNSKNWQRAADEYEQAARILPGVLDLRQHRAACLAKQQKYDEAIQQYRAVAKLYRANGKSDDAKHAYERAFALKPVRDQTVLHAELAEILMSGQPQEAIKHYKEALKTEPKQWTYLQGLAQACQATGEWGEAEKAYSRAIELQPSNFNLLIGRAWAFRQLKDADHAAQDYESAIKLAPANHLMWFWIADTYLENGNIEGVKRSLERGARLNPTNEQFPLRLATVHLLLKDTTEYRATCERLLHQFDTIKNPVVANNVAWACALAPNAVNEPDRAIRLVKRAVELQPWNANALDTLGALLCRAGDFDGAIERLTASRSSNRIGPTVLYDQLFLAMAYQGAGRADDAKETLERVIRQLEPHPPRQGGPSLVPVMDVWQSKEIELLRNEAEKLIRPAT